MAATVKNIRSFLRLRQKRRKRRKFKLQKFKDPELLKKLLRWEPLTDNKGHPKG